MMKKFVFISIMVLFVVALLTACGSTPSGQIKAGYGEEFVCTQSQNQIMTL